MRDERLTPGRRELSARGRLWGLPWMLAVIAWCSAWGGCSRSGGAPAGAGKQERTGLRLGDRGDASETRGDAGAAAARERLKALVNPRLSRALGIIIKALRAAGLPGREIDALVAARPSIVTSAALSCRGCAAYLGGANEIAVPPRPEAAPTLSTTLHELLHWLQSRRNPGSKEEVVSTEEAWTDFLTQELLGDEMKEPTYPAGQLLFYFLKQRVIDRLGRRGLTPHRANRRASLAFLRAYAHLSGASLRSLVAWVRSGPGARCLPPSLPEVYLSTDLEVYHQCLPPGRVAASSYVLWKRSHDHRDIAAAAVAYRFLMACRLRLLQRDLAQKRFDRCFGYAVATPRLRARLRRAWDKALQDVRR